MQSLHVLIVDDDPDDVEFLAGALCKYLPDAWFSMCQNGKDTLTFVRKTIAENRCPDLIFLDLHMPGTGGYQVLEELRSWDACHDTPIMIISTSMMDTEAERCRQAGCTEYFTKPVTLEGYDDIVAKAVGHVKA